MSSASDTQMRFNNKVNHLRDHLQIPRIGDFDGATRTGVGDAVIWWKSHAIALGVSDLP
jgi:hypothetical protein